jgi:dTDP-4-amino-4,6-dideoxygalactose transaminase
MNFINTLKYKIKKNKSKYIYIFTKVLNTGIFINGNFTKKLEKNLQNYLNTKYCITCANGTDALEIAFKSLSLKSGDKVFIAANAGMYSATSLNNLNITPQYFDICMDNYEPTIDIIKSIKSKPKAIVITHLYGRINKDIIKISNYCRKNAILLIEDCAQAIGTSLEKKKAGTFGDAATFSFYPTKNLFGLGDGGAVTFKLKKNFIFAKMLKQYGWKKKYDVCVIRGQNSRIDEINAEIINFNLLSLDSDNKKRIDIALTYASCINHKYIYVPKILTNNECNYHLFIILVKRNRNKLINYLRQNKIFPEVHYPIPDHKQRINMKKYKNLKLPNTELLSHQVLSLPCHPNLAKKQVKKISMIINKWV